MTDRELMKQSLEALWSCDVDYIFDGEDERPVDVYDKKKVAEAIKALRARLAQPEPYLWNVKQNRPPVSSDNLHEVFAIRQREWHGLTLNEIFNIWHINHDDGGATDKFARAIEAKLKEKNFG